MKTDRELMQQALDDLMSCSGAPHWPVFQPTITALRERLAKQKNDYASEADAEELIRTNKLPEPLRLAAMLEETLQWPLHGKAADCLRKLHAELEAIKQAITDPENQPSQFGTVTMRYMQHEIAAEREACAKVCDGDWMKPGRLFAAAIRERGRDAA